MFSSTSFFIQQIEKTPHLLYKTLWRTNHKKNVVYTHGGVMAFVWLAIEP